MAQVVIVIPCAAARLRIIIDIRIVRFVAVHFVAHDSLLSGELEPHILAACGPDAASEAAQSP
jgi:hypothetical protein